MVHLHYLLERYVGRIFARESANCKLDNNVADIRNKRQLRHHLGILDIRQVSGSTS